MIAKYTCKSDASGSHVHGEILHREGISVAGDQLVKRLLERIIVPKFASAVDMTPGHVRTLFGKRSPRNADFQSDRVNWINQLFVPLAQRYLDNAVNGVTDEISQTDGAIVPPELLESLQSTINRLYKPGTYAVRNPLTLKYSPKEFEGVVSEVFDDLILGFCESIVEKQADVVLLAGQPTKLSYIREMVETCLPLPHSRIVSMYGRYAGMWYPYQDQSKDNLNPGRIIDPKSTVVVGAAIKYAADQGWLSLNLEMEDLAAKESYYWGTMIESRIGEAAVLFKADGTEGECEFAPFQERQFIGRKRRANPNAVGSPVYVLTIDKGNRDGKIDVKIKLRRKKNELGEEVLELSAADGLVAGARHVWTKTYSSIGERWRSSTTFLTAARLTTSNSTTLDNHGPSLGG